MTFGAVVKSGLVSKIVQQILVIFNNASENCHGASIAVGSSKFSMTTYAVSPLFNFDTRNYNLPSFYVLLSEIVDSLSNDLYKLNYGTSLADLASCGYRIKSSPTIILGNQRCGSVSDRNLSSVSPVNVGNIIVASDEDATSIGNAISVYNPYHVVKNYTNTIAYISMDGNEDCIYLYPSDSTELYSVYVDDKIEGVLFSDSPIDIDLVKLLYPEVELRFNFVKSKTLYKLSNNGYKEIFTYTSKGTNSPHKGSGKFISEFQCGNFHAINLMNFRFYHRGSPIISNPYTLEYMYWYKTSIGYVPVGNIDLETYTGVDLVFLNPVNLDECKQFYFYNGIALNANHVDLEYIVESIEPRFEKDITYYLPFAKYPLWIGTFYPSEASNMLLSKDDTEREDIVSMQLYIEEVDVVVEIRDNCIVNIYKRKVRDFEIV